MPWNNTTLGVVLCPHEHENYARESIVILGFCSFPVIVAGVVACLLSIRIFTHPVMRASPINWSLLFPSSPSSPFLSAPPESGGDWRYLAVLSTSDLLVLMATFFMLCLPRLGEWLGFFGAYRASLFASPYMYPTGATAQTVSVYMTVLMSAHRFIGVCFPFRVLPFVLLFPATSIHFDSRHVDRWNSPGTQCHGPLAYAKFKQIDKFRL